MMVINYLILILMMILSVGVFTVVERKMLSLFQLRFGPIKFSYLGMLQFLNDSLKLILKELLKLIMINFGMYYFSCLLELIFSLMLWFIMPFLTLIMILNLGMLIFLLILSLKIIMLMLMSWSVNCNYSFISFIRMISQVITYEMILISMILIMMYLINSMNFMLILLYQKYCFFFFMMLIMSVIFFISMLIELNRLPFDFYEGESELISGFNIEFNSMMFMFIFLFEYLDMIYLSMFLSLLLFGSDLLMLLFYLKMIVLLLLLILIRGFLVRYRYDLMMMMMWKIFLPIILNNFFFILIFKLYLI